MRHQALGLALLLMLVGCGGGGGGKDPNAAAAWGLTNPGATAPTASGTTAATTSAAGPSVLQAPGPKLVGATFQDRDGSGTVTEGDEVELAFDQAMSIPPVIDPAVELRLSVQGDTFGKGAKLEVSPTDPRSLLVKLGQGPKLKINGPYDAAQTAAGAPSGIEVSASGTGIVTNAAGIVAQSASPVDVDGLAAGQFKPAASLYFARGLHTTHVLDDGRVLVVGGRGRLEFIPECELYDPLTNNWERTDRKDPDKGFMKHSDMKVKRTMHASVKLKDGRILITGGYGVKRKGWFGLYGEKMEQLDCAHIFDPKTDKFTEVGHMVNARRSHKATLMSDGRVLITGGYDDSWWHLRQTLPEAEIYDPSTNKFTAASPMVLKRMYHTATAMKNGTKVVCIGGEQWDGGWVFPAKNPKLQGAVGGDVYENDKFTRSADLTYDRRFHQAVELGSGEVLVIGGDNRKEALKTLERMDPNNLRFTKAGELRTARTTPAVIRTGGEVLIAGGMGMGGSKLGGELGDCEVYDEKTGTITKTIKMVEPRNSTAMVELKDGRVMLIGGMSGGVKDQLSLDGNALQSCEMLERP